MSKLLTATASGAAGDEYLFPRAWDARASNIQAIPANVDGRTEARSLFRDIVHQTGCLPDQRQFSHMLRRHRHSERLSGCAQSKNASTVVDVWCVGRR